MPLQMALLRRRGMCRSNSAELSLLDNRRRARTDMQNVDRVQQA